MGIHEAEALAAENHHRAPWGCKWFVEWVQNVQRAHRLGQTLEVYYFQGEVGLGKVSWEGLATTNNWDGVGLGGSQKCEVAFLEKEGIPYEEFDSSVFDDTQNTGLDHSGPQIYGWPSTL